MTKVGDIVKDEGALASLTHQAVQRNARPRMKSSESAPPATQVGTCDRSTRFLVNKEKPRASIVTASDTVPCARDMPAVTTTCHVLAYEAEALALMEEDDVHATVASAAEWPMRN